MDYSKAGTQTRSLVVSIGGHCALLALCAYLSYSIQNLPSTHQATHNKPASVSWLPGEGGPSPASGAPRDGVPETASQNITAASELDTAEPEVMTSNMPKTMAIPEQEDIESSMTKEIGEPEAPAIQEPVGVRNGPSNSRPLATRNSTNDTPYGRNDTISSAQPSKRKITGAAFMGAFRQSMQTEATEQAVRRSYGADGGSPAGNGTGTGSGNGPAHVQERLNEWQWADYNGKVWRALVKSAKTFKKYVRTPTAVRELLTVNLVLDKQGKVKNIDDIPKVGIADVDDFIKEFFLTTNFPDIPKRFPTNETRHKITISLRMSEGGHYMYLEPSHE